MRNRKLFDTVLSGLLALPFASLLTEPAVAGVGGERSISADFREVKGAKSQMPQFCVGAGRANEGLRADWQRQLRIARDELGFRYIRFHGLFCDDMGVYFEEKGEPVYNWQYIDELFDYLLKIGMKPFVEVGFMPAGLSSGPQTIFWYRGNVTPPRSYAKWEALVRAFVEHCTERYGRAEVKTWYFEVWNEPNLDGFWTGNPQKLPYEEWVIGARAEYFKLYASTAKAIKSVDSSFRVGGPATAGEGWIDETLAYCADNKVPLDFISTHSYGTTSGYLDEHGNAGTILAPDINSITDGVKNVRKKIESSSFSGIELHYTEWSASYTPADPVHDAYHSASFILNKLKGSEGAAQSMSYWTFTDIFEEVGPRHTAFHGGFGLMNYQDIKKPSFFAYRFLNQLGATELKNQDTASYVCKDDSGGVQALFWDFTLTQAKSTVNNQIFFAEEQPARSLPDVLLSLRNLPAGKYSLKATKVGYRANDVQSAWRDLGSPRQLSPAQVLALKAASAGEPEKDELVWVDASGVFEQKLPLRENDVWLVQLTPR